LATIQSIIEYVERLSGHRLNADEGVHYGDPKRTVERMVVCWMATIDALEYAGKQSADLVLAHESLFYPYGALIGEDASGEAAAEWQSWNTNRRRVELMDRYALTVLRIHGSLDEICILDDFATLLGLGRPVEAQGLVKVYEVPPCTVRDLIDRVKHATGMGVLRVAAPAGFDQTVHRVGLPWGGLGLFVNVSYQQALIERRCDVMIAGESDNYGARFVADLGIPIIETDHEVSENPGLRHFTEMLDTEFSDLDVSFFECKRVWESV
jgi:putative NIF3 family GTP cyclohydrolase 1 type 2